VESSCGSRTSLCLATYGNTLIVTPPIGALRRRAALVEAAIEVLARDGARGLTEAGVPGGTASNYFASRDELLHQVLTLPEVASSIGVDDVITTLVARAAQAAHP
jgi:DNA-binding transcriptional regulator YbjK